MQREATKVLSGEEYDHLFPKALMTTQVEKEGATVSDTIKLIPRVVRETLWQTGKIAKALKGKSVEETCWNIWEFVYKHVAYKKDENGKEQVRSPARTWHDRHNKNANGNPGGVDCDCMTTFISSILSNLNIKHVLRIVKFWEAHYQHIYPVVILPGGKQITIDCVVHNFNYEEPYSEKHDTKMNLEYLNGVYDSDVKSSDAQDLSGAFDETMAFSELGKLFKRKSSGGGGGSAPPKKKINLKPVFQRGAIKKAIQKAPIKQVFQKGGIKKAIQKAPIRQVLQEGGLKKVIQQKGGVKQIAKNLLNKANKLNPAVVPLRIGILAAMKLNFMKIAQRLKYAYLSDAEAQKRDVDMTRFQKLKQVRAKLESVFYAAGGKPENLKEAILKGKGNKNKDVMAGLGYIYEDMTGMDHNTPISQLLGDVYYSEGVEGMEGTDGLGEIGELGEPVTAAAITAATGALSAIAVVLKQVGNIFKRKTKDSKDFEDGEGQTNADASEAESASANDPSPAANENSFTDSGNDDANTTSAYEGSNSDYGSGGSYSSSAADSGDNYSDAGDEGNKNLPATTSQNLQDNNDGENDNSAGRSAARGVAPATDTTQSQTFWQKNKSWLLPTSIGGGILLIAIGGYIILKRPKENQPAQTHQAISGIPRSRKRKKSKKKGGSKPKIQSKKKKSVAFM